MSQAEKLYHRVVCYGLLVILALPLLATLFYALSREWSDTILPQGITLSWFIELWQDPRFLTALGHSLIICLGALIFSLLLVLPVMFVIAYYYPKLDNIMGVLILMPFAVPPVVSSVGLLQLYSSAPLMLTGTPWILIGCYFTIALPFMYRAIANNMQSVNLKELMDAAHLLGAGTFRAAVFVVLPNLRKGVMVAVLLSFSFLIGEFVFANMQIGRASCRERV